ncbi:hypothetical protein FVEN_g12989 [Fusarium venenatum]|nr:hypothetical protein FVEN_g12989 [Fusarium venenatum]
MTAGFAQLATPRRPARFNGRHMSSHAWPGFIKKPSTVSYLKAQARIYRARFGWGVCWFKTGHQKQPQQHSIQQGSPTVLPVS